MNPKRLVVFVEGEGDSESSIILLNKVLTDQEAWDCAFADPCMIELMGGDISDVVKSRYTTADERAKEAKSVY